MVSISSSFSRRQGRGARISNAIISRSLQQLQQRRFIWTVNSETGVVSHNKEPRFQTIIGLEIHAQLDIPTKLFSRAKVSTSMTQAPNTLIQPFDLAVPGTLPMTSKSAVQAAVLTAAALQCEIAPSSRFERKHYHYADLPFGYQVTQQRWPIARNGILRVTPKTAAKATTKQKSSNHQTVSVGIDRIQLEQDTGKTTTTTTTVHNTTKNGKPQTITKSLVDFNRAGCALVEIVMNPDLRSSKHAAATVETLRQLLKHIGTCNGRMEEGSLRVDLNVSIQPIHNIDLFIANMNNRVEVKNLNSLRQVQQAAEYEAIRQAKLLSEDQTLTFQETRTYNVKLGKTVLIRTKEGDEDYRFMPEPDLPPVVLNEQILGQNKSLEDFLAEYLPELPEAARQRLSNDYQLDAYTASVIASDPPAIQIYDDAVQACRNNLLLSHGDNNTSNDNNTENQEQLQKAVPKEVAKVLINDLFSHIREEEEHAREMEQFTGSSSTDDMTRPYSTVNGQQLGELVSILMQGTISKTMAKNLLKILFYEDKERGVSPKQVAQERGIQLISDPEQLRNICQETIHQYPEKLEQYRMGGKHVIKMKKFLVGKAMTLSKGNAHPERLHEALEEVLEEMAPGVQ